ncbi:endonuclease NucS domain-containing protein [Geoalkalibacter halelectricus]|uniref:endonuclease NucS domain-containing protein n=1 Tax=Geoalkalibacter halelectricus TaxID=2847045 RepID=UPI003D209E4E
MRVFGIQSDGKFSEYIRTPFQVDHEEAILEEWLESNPDGIVEDGRILIIGRQVVTNFGGFIDLLGVDRHGDVVVVELKRDRTPRDTIAQSLEYVSFAERLDTAQLEGVLRSYLNDESLSLAEHHREYFELGLEEAIAFNKDQRIVIVGQPKFDTFADAKHV